MIYETLYTRCPALLPLRESIAAAHTLLCSSFAGGGKLLLCGNGGSAADSGHIVGELMKSFLRPRPLTEQQRAALAAAGEEAAALADKLERGLPAISLCAHEALMTAVVNDTAAETVFAQQVMALGRPGDVLLAISTSGGSGNCVAAARVALALGMSVIALTGEGGGKLGQIATVTLAVPERETYKVQELHLPLYHALCAAIEEEFFGG